MNKPAAAPKPPHGVEPGALRVLTVVPYFPPSVAGGGIRAMAADVSLALAELGCGVTVLTTDVGDRRNRAGSRALPADDPPGLRVVRLRNLSNRLAFENLFLPFLLPGSSGAGAGRPALPASVEAALGRFDVIHLHGHRHLLAPLARHLARRRGRPLFLSTHGTTPRLEGRFLAKRVYDALAGDRILRAADRIVAASRIECLDFALAGIPEERVIVIPNCIPTGAFEKLPPRGMFRKRLGIGSRPLVLFVGSITERKGVHHLARAMGRVKPADAILAAAGLDFGFGRVVRAAAGAAGASDRIVYTGHLSDEARLEAYADADLFVLPSEREVFGLAAFEALLCGIPVIATSGTGCGETLQATSGGWVVPPGDPERLSDAVSHALTHPSEGRERAAKGRAVVLEEMNIRTHAMRLSAAYRTALSSRPESGPARDH